MNTSRDVEPIKSLIPLSKLPGPFSVSACKGRLAQLPLYTAAATTMSLTPKGDDLSEYVSVNAIGREQWGHPRYPTTVEYQGTCRSSGLVGGGTEDLQAVVAVVEEAYEPVGLEVDLRPWFDRRGPRRAATCHTLTFCQPPRTKRRQ
jgi:hypothetical protein